jgi:bifunctional non-homologous end joining protein LigD
MSLTKFIPCIPTRGTRVPAGPDWLHEVKYDGYRMIVHRDGDRVWLFTRNGHDWSDRYPWIVDSARWPRQKQFVIDGEAVVLGVDGISDFAALYSRRHDEEMQFYAFDMMAGAGRPIWRGCSPGRATAYSSHNSNWARSGLILETPRPAVPGGRSRPWVKVKNPASPAMTRARDVDWSKSRG